MIKHPKIPGLLSLAPQFTAAMLLQTALACTTISSPLEEGPAASEVPPDDEYIVGITHIRFAEGGADTFDGHFDTLQMLIREAPGNVGVSYRIDVTARDRWTMSIWTDASRMGAFVASPEHIAAIRDILPGAEIARTARYQISAQDYPPNWDDALDALETHGVDR